MFLYLCMDKFTTTPVVREWIEELQVGSTQEYKYLDGHDRVAMIDEIKRHGKALRYSEDHLARSLIVKRITESQPVAVHGISVAKAINSMGDRLEFERSEVSESYVRTLASKMGQGLSVHVHEDKIVVTRGRVAVRSLRAVTMQAMSDGVAVMAITDDKSKAANVRQYVSLWNSMHDVKYSVRVDMNGVWVFLRS